ncbi:head fiber protein [Bifidobacterium scaligerum]|uniref:Head fiber protein n=1 Tax=Bifidobacterium scaligerum TaxID=2052656 RepID=A0A2M9HT69_9BIFI|nr:head fiber protein [Bifidobacterium scaligerum]PJM80005.1 hypothetical protein CUU80_02400 [Bifidobacterium scaligerum]
MAKQIRFVSQPAIVDGQDVAEIAAFDADDNPVDVGGGSKAPDAGSVTPASLSGYDPGTGHSKMVKVKADGSGFDFVDDSTTPPAGSVTNAMLAGGITKDKLAAGVIPAAYTLPAASSAALGGVKKGAAVPNLAADADATAIAATVNSLLVQLRAAGVITA